ncbi:MAG: ParB/RepB/Spo0J family partition protein [Candidatus Nealsonbacteria bacterium]|nr:ParB/RepB/Spo0J family partition protein [Candidatus Nealsonbacteria bacterium]
MMNDRRALGKGIGALIPPAPVSAETGKAENVAFIPTSLIKPNTLQPREEFNPQSMEELVQSIREKGIIQPVLVRRRGEHYELIAGERRLRAANILSLNEIPAIIKEVEDLDSLEIALIENIQRENLNSIEEAKACNYLMEKFGLTQERISEVLGKARATVANTLRLLKLPLEIQKDIANGSLSFAHGKTLLEIEDVGKQMILSQMCISKSLSVRELENLIKKLRPKSSRTKNSAGGLDGYVMAREEQLQQALATKVRILKRKKRGQIVIEFYSQDDLERIANKICGT